MGGTSSSAVAARGFRRRKPAEARLIFNRAVLGAAAVALALFAVPVLQPAEAGDALGVHMRVDPVHAQAGTAKGKSHRAGRSIARRSHRISVAQQADALNAMAAVSGNELIAEARKYLGRNPTGWSRAWCGRFLDMVLRKTGHKGGGNLARAYIRYGTRLAGPEVGAIGVFSRKGGGHVGIVTGIDANGNPIIISGNYNDRVSISTYPASRALAYVRPVP